MPDIADVLMHETRDFQPALCELLTRKGWQWYHTHDSRRSNPGYPDLTIWAPRRGVWWAELKRQPVPKVMRDLNGDVIARTRRPKITPEQLQTLRDLPDGRAVILIPSDLGVLEQLSAPANWDSVIRILARRINEPACLGLRIGK